MNAIVMLVKFTSPSAIAMEEGQIWKTKINSTRENNHAIKLSIRKDICKFYHILDLCFHLHFYVFVVP